VLDADEDSSHSKKRCYFGILYEGFNSKTSFLVQGALLFLEAYVRSYRHHTDTEEDIATVMKMVARISVSDSNGYALFSHACIDYGISFTFC